MQNLSQPFPKQAHVSDMKEQENQQTTKQRKRRKGCLHNWWRIQSIRISSENTRKKKQPPRFERKQEDHNWFCIKILRYFLPVQD